FIGKLGGWGRGILPNQKVFFRVSLMEPMIMAVLGVLVGGLIVAMYLPIFQLGKVI
ncbi:type II secretion system F family protein, partial [Pseudomonas aeruginosa]|nr:type II secretion system F family protein [Pseudomonas aeruginosa]